MKLLIFSILIIFSEIQLSLAQTQDHYQVLGLSKDADAKAIKKAYRKLSMKYHPDRNPGDEEAADKYLDINAAYEVLNNA